MRWEAATARRSSRSGLPVPHASLAFGIGSVGGGQVLRKGSGVYNLAKNGDGAFGESLRQEVTKLDVCVSLAAILLCDRPAYQWIKISEMSRSKVLRAIGFRSSIPKNVPRFPTARSTGTHATPMSNYVIAIVSALGIL